MISFPSRRTFMAGAAALSASVILPKAEAEAEPEGINVLGPKPGYTPKVGTLVSMLAWMRPAVTRPVKGITLANLDVLFDAKANSIGALLLHLATTERLYQINTFERVTDLDKLPKSYKETWGAAMELGDTGRKTIKGHDLDFYLAKLQETLQHSLSEFKNATTRG